MNEKILPLGTVVTVEGGKDEEFMIVVRAVALEEKGEEVYYDYGAVLIPDGMIVPETVHFFNREQVKEVIFQGFKNNEEIEYENNYEEMISQSGLKKGSIE